MWVTGTGRARPQGVRRRSLLDRQRGWPLGEGKRPGREGAAAQDAADVCIQIFILLPSKQKEERRHKPKLLEIIVSYLRTNTSIENVQKQAWTPIFVNFADLCANHSTIKRAASARLGKRGFICTLEFYKSFIMLYLWMDFVSKLLWHFCYFFCRGDRYVLLAV